MLKSQTTNSKLQTKHNDQNPKRFGILNLEFGISRSAHSAGGAGAGQAALLAVLFLFLISLAVSLGFVAIANRAVQNARADMDAKRSFFLAEAGVEDVVYRLKTAKQVSSSESYALGGAAASVTLTDIAGGKEVLATGNANNAIRRSKAVVQQGLTGVGFAYGVQVDAGGLEMEQNSRIEGAGGVAGNVYANGPIEGENGAVITGDATAAGGLGSISDVIVKGTARVHAVAESKICGDAYYTTIDADSLNFVNAATKPSECSTPWASGTAYPGSADPSPAAFPISDSQIQQWRDDAAAGGAITGNCGDSGAAECVIADNGTLFLGPKKVVGNLALAKKQTLVITGTLYFTGSISISSSNVTVKCDPSYGSHSCMIIADGWINVSNNAVFQGSGASGSYLMALTAIANCNGGPQTPSCTNHNAGLEVDNNAQGSIFYVPHSMAYVKNNARMTELTAYKITLENNAIITYQQGLADLQFSSGPTGGWVIQTWEEVE